MLNFFKNIRKNYTITNNTRKHLRYALREIVLVVIGILIAIQINNLNEASKLKKQELKLLQQISYDIEVTLEDIDNEIKNIKAKNSAMDTVIAALKNSNYKLRTSVFLAKQHNKSFLNIINSGYTRLLNTSNDLIQNDSILNTIIELYEVDFDNTLRLQSLMHNQIDNNLFPLTNTFFEVAPEYKINFTNTDVTNTNLMKPINSISDNNNYKNILYQLKQNYNDRLKQLQFVVNKGNKLIKGIHLEIKNR